MEEPPHATGRQRLSGRAAGDRAPPHRPSAAGGSQATAAPLLPVELGAGSLGALQRLSRGEGVTLFMTVLAVLQVGAAPSYRRGARGRGHRRRQPRQPRNRGDDRLLRQPARPGHRPRGDPSFRELLARVRETALGAYAHQDLPFDRAVEALNLPRNLKATPLFQTKLIFQNLPSGPIEITDLRFTPLPMDTGTAQLDLTLVAAGGGEILRGWANYSTDLFDEATIRRFLRPPCRPVLAEVAERPDAPSQRSRHDPVQAVHEEPSRGKERHRQAQPVQEREAQGRDPGSRRPARRNRLPPAGADPPPGLHAEGPGVRSRRVGRRPPQAAREQTARHGALLFRGFSIDSPEAFERFAGAVCDELFNENGEHPRENVTGNVYTPVFYPPDKQLIWHNENSFNHQWPSKILFCCMEAPPVGGETPIVDSRRVFDRWRPSIRDRFVDKGVMYTRSYGTGLGLTWQEVFRTSDRQEVEERCHEEGFEAQWRERDTLRTSCRRPAAVLHPVTGEPVWFNQAQHWHVSCLDPETRESILSLFTEETLPRSCCYGDGSPIPDTEMAAILDVYRELEVSFPWQPGDILMLDNLLTAHGRNPFSGRRKILVALGDMKSYDQVTDPGAR